MRTADNDLLVVGYDLEAECEVHIRDRPMPEWRQLGYGQRGTIVCFLCWNGVDSEPGTRVPPVPRGRLGGRVRAHFAHPPGSAKHDSRRARETIWHLNTKLRLTRCAQALPCVAEARVERWTPDMTRRADVLVILRDGARLALEAQSRIIPDGRWEDRHADYAASGIADVWFMRPGAAAPYVLFEAGAQAFTIHDNGVDIPLGHGHPRRDGWWNEDPAILAWHYPPCAGDPITTSRFPLEHLTLDAEGLVIPGEVRAQIAADRARAGLQVEAERRRAEAYVDRMRRAAARPQVIESEVGPTPRQAQIAELRNSLRIKQAERDRKQAGEHAAKPVSAPVTKPPLPSWLPKPAFTVDLVCASCGAQFGVLTEWPKYMGVPRAKHPLQCTECGNLSGAACPCRECT
jgi:hypothetical protein